MNNNRPSSQNAPRQSGITRVVLTHFRSYPSLSLQTSLNPVVLTGANGEGKTNILEALSFFSPGKGMRGIRLGEASHRHAGDSPLDPPRPWYVSVTSVTDGQEFQLGTGFQQLDQREKRLLQVDGEPLKTQLLLTDYINIIWLTPQMDRLFSEGTTVRRRFLDRLVYGFDPLHATRLNRYEHFMRERNNLLQQGRYDPIWVQSLEQKMAGEAVAIAASRRWVIQQLHRAEAWMLGLFPSPALSVSGTVEDLLETHKALEAEEAFAGKLKTMRNQDQASGRTLEGVHRSDFQVVYREKNMLAEYCSTGEQKALLIAIIMATARLQTQIRPSSPILLLDEVAAHLDEQRRERLFAEILDLRMQAWITGTEPDLFIPLGTFAQHFHVESGNVKPL